MSNRSIVSISDYSKEKIQYLLDMSAEMERHPNRRILQGKVVATLFFEPSTRTRLSFETAANRLGARVIGFSDPKATSSSKGETLKDTIKMVSNYADVIVMRHSLEGAALYASEVTDTPIINAGDGSNLHPSQTMLDLYSIYKTQGRLDNLNIEAHGNSVVNKGEIWSNRQRINLSENTISNVTTTDSANHLYVKRNQRLDKSDLFTSLSLTFGLDLGFPIAGTTNARRGSPYNTGIDLTFNMVIRTNQISLGGRWSWDVGMLLAYHAVTLDNVVKPSGSTSLVLDASYGATPPHQQLLYTTLGLPVSLRYSLPKKYRPWFRGFHASLTPMVNFKQELSSQSLGSNNRWHTESDKDLDLFNRFNVRAEVGMDVSIIGFHSVDFFIDLLPSYKPAANAPQMRMMGLIYHF